FRGLGCGIVALLALLILGAAFLWSFGLAATKSTGRYGDSLFYVWFGVGGIGALLILIVSSFFMGRFFLGKMPETAEHGRHERVVLQILAICGALCIGAVAAIVIFGLTCAAILGGASVGGF